MDERARSYRTSKTPHVPDVLGRPHSTPYNANNLIRKGGAF
jgi:hypothetical protein